MIILIILAMLAIIFILKGKSLIEKYAMLISKDLENNTKIPQFYFAWLILGIILITTGTLTIFYLIEKIVLLF